MLQNMIEKARRATSHEQPVGEVRLAFGNPFVDRCPAPYPAWRIPHHWSISRRLSMGGIRTARRGCTGSRCCCCRVKAQDRSAPHRRDHQGRARFRSANSLRPGDPLITLDDTTAKANFDAIRSTVLFDAGAGRSLARGNDPCN